MSSFRPRECLLLLGFITSGSFGFAATDVRVNFTLNTTDADGAPLQQQRYYYVYRPDNLSLTTPVPMILVMDQTVASFFHRKADQAGFVVISCFFAGNSTGNPGKVWINDDPRIVGYEDYDYTSEVIRRVKVSDNTGDVFINGLSKGGHMALAYACERPSMIQAASSLDEFMGLTANHPSAPVPVIVFEGTADTAVPYTMVRDTVDAWRAVNGLLSVTPAITYESSPLGIGKVTQATWRGGLGGTQVAFVTIIGGTHTHPTPTIETGYDFTDGIWAFFSQYLTTTQTAPKIVSHPVNNSQLGDRPASFWVAATGTGPLSYQWQKNGEDIPGATTNWLTVPAAPADDGAILRAVVRNASGTATSERATLTVKTPPAGPVITTQPESQTVIAGQPVTFTSGATGTPPLRYQWQKNGVNVVGATTPSLSIAPAISPDSGANFTVIVSNTDGFVTSTRAALTVTPAAGAPIMLTNPVRSRVLIGQVGTFSVSAWSAEPMSYQWQKTTFGGNMSDIQGATGATYSTPPTTLSDHLTLFRCVVSNPAGSVASASEMLFVTAAPAAPNSITSVISASAQLGVPFRYTITSSGGTSPIIYNADPLPDGFSFDASSGIISGAPAATGIFAITVTAANDAGQTSRTLTLTVTADPPVISLRDWRFANFGASAIDPTIAGDGADPDGDGYTNLDEFTFGSNPLDSTSVPTSGANPAPKRPR